MHVDENIFIICLSSISIKVTRIEQHESTDQQDAGGKTTKCLSSTEDHLWKCPTTTTQPRPWFPGQQRHTIFITVEIQVRCVDTKPTLSKHAARYGRKKWTRLFVSFNRCGNTSDQTSPPQFIRLFFIHGSSMHAHDRQYDGCCRVTERL